MVSAVSVALVGLFSFVSVAAAAPVQGSLEESCIAAGTVLPSQLRGFMFNHHPEKKREPRAGDHYQTVLETVAEYNGVVPRMPADCEGHFSQVILSKAQFQASRSPHRWRSLRRRWERLPLAVNTLEFIGDPPPLSSFGIFQGQQGLNTFGLGCTLRGRVLFKFEVVNEANEAIVAVRTAQMPLQVDSWFQARCLGKFSIQESSGARRCGQVLGARAGGGPAFWGVKVARVGCAKARAIAQHSLETPSFLRGLLSEEPVGEWRCFYGHRGASACSRGRSHIFLVSHRGGTGEECRQAPRGVRGLRQASSSCAIAQQLAEAVASAPRAEETLSLGVAGSSFTCGVEQTLGLGDRMDYSYACAASGAIVSFEIREPKSARLIPTPPNSIPPEVQLPPAGLLGFPRTPKLKFDYAVTRGGKIWLPLEVDPALIGRTATLEITVWTMQCEWTADPSDTSPTCPTQHRRGPTRRRKIALQASQQVLIGRNHHQGNWNYAVWAKTKPFVSEGLPYTHAAGWGYAVLINRATNCSANPWCHPNH